MQERINHLDLSDTYVEVCIRCDGKVLWINTEEGCVLRISKIRGLHVIDHRLEIDDDLNLKAP